MILLLLRLWAVTALALNVLAYRLPEEPFWSLWPYTVFPPWLGWSLTLATASLVIPPWNARLQQAVRRLWTAVPAKHRSGIWFAAAGALSLPLFWGFRIRHLGWGDARILVDGLSCLQGPACPGGPVIYNWQAPLTVFLHQRLWQLVASPRWGWGVDTMYAAVSVLCGGLFVVVLLHVANRLGRSAPEKGLVAGFVLTTGSMQLFFGYVENYTLITLGIIVFVWAGLKTLSDEAPLWAATLALSVTNAFHPSTVVLWPAALYLAWRRWRRGTPPARILLDVALPPLIMAGAVLTLMETGNHGLHALLGDDRPGGGDHIWFVPLFEITTGWQRYTMFSPAHLLDWANELFLTSVFGGITLLAAGAGVWQSGFRRGRAGAPVWFLSLAGGCYLLLTWVWNADYGIRKDWDLFSPAAVVYSLLAALLLIHALKEKAALAQAALLIVAVSGLHTAAWVLNNAFPPG